MSTVNIEYVDKLHPIFTKPKRIKIVVGGRGSTKSTGIADYVAAQMTNGQLWCCAREHQNSIEESVHRTILDEIERLGMTGFEESGHDFLQFLLEQEMICLLSMGYQKEI